MNKPMKCECGKMISRPKANKSGRCWNCNHKKLKRDAETRVDEK